MSHPTINVIRRVHLASQCDATQLFDVFCTDGKVTDIRNSGQLEEHTSGSSARELDAGGKGILLPSLCHSHIHLDKCFLLDMCDELVSGSFAEALRVTSKTKSRFASGPDDLYARGSRLILESVQAGVTSMRAHVEVDLTVGMSCVEAGLRLKNNFKNICDVQLAVFAQDPLYLREESEPSDNYTLLKAAAATYGVSAIGSAPYVEPSFEQAKNNIIHVLDLAEAHNLHVDFHLDYNADPSSEPLIYFLIDQLHARSWADRIKEGLRAHVTIGHATRLSLFSSQEWEELVKSIGDLPISFVALPQSDLYMIRGYKYVPPGLGPHRYTLRVPQLKRMFGLDIAMSVNNVENAFTPQGPVDPLALCPLGVATYQAGTTADCISLLASTAVTCGSKRAIGKMNAPERLSLAVGDPADFVLVHGNNSVQSTALNPGWERTTIKGGVVVASRRADMWILR
ncbi:Metallo-dependent hydrolase [Neolentinus lepideus HHB14362 ss-1]|uniref:Metallo-dependent hydrolase n=1 Tax=Neolentinus lepideus HHB14362 ss-1 TaxID=1314782 RepID=A0A165UMR9_9AGAM|nr:Metallo-dependent hydrolase [Neolentinus lepideus HHB14362 ss-1]